MRTSAILFLTIIIRFNEKTVRILKSGQQVPVQLSKVKQEHVQAKNGINSEFYSGTKQAFRQSGF